MSVAPPKLRRRKQGTSVPLVFVLSGVFSLLTHGALLLVVFMSLRSCHQLPVGFTNETGDIGIVAKQDGDLSQSESTDALTESDQPSGSTTAPNIDVPANATSEQPPVEPLLPSPSSLTKVGPGTNMPVDSAVTDPRQPVKSDGGVHPGKMALPGGPLGASFMGSRDEGSKVIFVIDASGSMSTHNSMQVAKSALISSLQALEETQQFLIIFYDDKPVVLNLKGDAKPQLYAANATNKNLARQKVSGIQPGTGTQHVPALEMALRLQPDVIFFLTDAQEPPIYPAELEELKRNNKKKTRIHSIEFGIGPEISETTYSNNFLRVLSRQNGGSYRYYDVTKFK